MPSRAGAIVCLLLLVLALLPGCSSSPETARVTRVVDGDTIVIEGGYHVRYIGIDTPEREKPYYQEARQCNQELVADRIVRLEADVTDKDKYNRLLRYVYVDGLFVNAELVRQGYAEVYPEDLFPDNKYYGLLKEAEEEARQARRGIWAS